MARTLTEPRMVEQTGRSAALARLAQAPVRSQATLQPTLPQTVLGDRTTGSQLKTHVARRSNKAVGRQMVAALVTSFVVSLLCLYVSAYARVTAEGFELSRLTAKIRSAQVEEQALEAAISKQSASETLIQRAGAMGMISGEGNAVNMMTLTAPSTNALSLLPQKSQKEQVETKPNP